MRCYGLVIPGGDASRFCLAFPSSSSSSSAAAVAAVNKPNPILRMRPQTSRVAFGSFRAKAVINDRIATDISFYELLGIPESGTLLDIKQAYKQLARKYHPDVSPPDLVEEYTERFIRVQEAYETLSDPSRRALYDRDVANGLHLAFSARRRCEYRNFEEMEERHQWKHRWQAQLLDLKRRCVSKDAEGNLSWGARMRRQREESSKGPEMSFD